MARRSNAARARWVGLQPEILTMFKPLNCSSGSVLSEAGYALRPDDFHRILQRERMRADRCEKPFSVLVFTADPALARRPNFVELIRYLRTRLRATDVVGHLDRQRLATLLFDTDRDGAQTLLDDIRASCLSAGQPIGATIHTYPAAPVSLSAATREATERRTVAPSPDMLFTRPMPGWKRILDISLASASVLVFSPLMVVAAVMIKVTTPGPILYCQRRAGLAGRPFLVYKFRTMHQGAERQQADLRKHSEQDGPAFKLKDDPRVTWVGKYLRKTCIDEFPQFWNVLRGEMSIVGPRPLPLDESADCCNWQRRRLDVTPGMTCIWQVSGGMRVSFIEWMRMDLRYIRERTLWHDFILLLKTARAVLFHRASH